MRNDHELGKGMLAGLIGGLTGTIVMTAFQEAWSGVQQKTKSKSSRKSSDGQSQWENSDQNEDATIKAAGKLALVAGRHLTHEQKVRFGPVIHYSFGTLQGAIYGGVMELTGSAGGFLPALIFGSTLFVAADEIAVPALGLTSRPSDTPVSSHLYNLASHLVYALSAELARRGLRAAL